MYGVAGERRLTEFELPWLDGYEGSTPVRVGNAASEQLQLDVYGEVLDALYQARVARAPDRTRRRGGSSSALLEHLEDAWREPDEGIWEIRGERRHFVHSKVMAWVAFDRAVRTVEEHGSRRAGRPLAQRARRDPPRRLRARLRREARLVHAVVRLDGARREPAAAAARRLPAGRPTRGSAARSRRSSGSSSQRRLRAPLPHARGRRRRAAGRRGRVPAVLVLARRLLRAARTPRRGAASSSSGSSASRTTSGCSRRSTTRRRSACSGTSRRRSRTSRSSTPPSTSRRTCRRRCTARHASRYPSTRR